jgi:uncharacterized protein (TIGR02588 family)
MAARKKSAPPPRLLDRVLQAVMTTVGALVTAACLFVVGKEAIIAQRPADLRVTEISRRVTPRAVLVEVRVENTGDQTAADVSIEARSAAAPASVGTATLDYVPGRSRGEATLSLPPTTTGPVALTVLGWTEP